MISKLSQAMGSTNVMVTVVATQELKAEDVLLRFKAEDSENNIYSKSIRTRPAFGNYCHICDSPRLYVAFVFLFKRAIIFARARAHVCVCVCVCVSV